MPRCHTNRYCEVLLDGCPPMFFKVSYIFRRGQVHLSHYNDVIMSAMASRISSLTTVYSIVYSGADQRKHQRSAWLAFVRRIHRWPVNSPHKGTVRRKRFPLDDVIKDNQVVINKKQNLCTIYTDILYLLLKLNSVIRRCIPPNTHNRVFGGIQRLNDNILSLRVWPKCQFIVVLLHGIKWFLWMVFMHGGSTEFHT